MSTFAQTSTQDLALTNGQLTLVTNVAAETAIELGNKFRFVQGEYFLDTREGVPYFPLIFVKNPNLQIVRQVFRSVILSCRGVKEILLLETSLDTKTRKLSFRFRARAIDGQIITGGSGEPFIVEPT